MPRPGRRPPARPPAAFGSFAVTKATVRRAAMAAFEPRYEATERVQTALRRIERCDHELATQPASPGGLLQRLRRETLARNAFATASIEGNTLSLEAVESLLRSDVSPASVHDPEELEILNYAAFMASPPALRAPRTPDDIRGVHAELFRGVLQDAGTWKREQNFIASRRTREVVYVPTEPARVVPELRNALEWLHESRAENPLVRAALFHHEFESIHPFRDGNGRTGRALTPMILHEAGYTSVGLAPIDFVVRRRLDEYYAHLAAVERGGFQDYTAWLEYMLDVFRAAYEEAVELALFQTRLPEGLAERQVAVAEWFARLRQQDASRRVKFNDVHHAFPEVAARTLKRDLAELRERGVLEVTGTFKGTTYRLGLGGPDARRSVGAGRY